MAGDITLVLDLETVPDTARWDRPTDEPDPFPPPWAHRIVCAGYAALDGDLALVKLDTMVGTAGDDDARERSVLDLLSRTIETHRPRIVTFNGRKFDLPVIAARSLLHVIPIAWHYQRDARTRYNDRLHLDLCDDLADHGAGRMSKLDDLARMIGLPGKEGIDGRSVETLYLKGDLAAIRRYCLRDVVQTAILFLRYEAIRGHVRPELQAKRESELVEHLPALAEAA